MLLIIIIIIYIMVIYVFLLCFMVVCLFAYLLLFYYGCLLLFSIVSVLAYPHVFDSSNICSFAQALCVFGHTEPIGRVRAPLQTPMP